jgi:hypothetical protein
MAAELTWQVIVLEQDAVLQSLMPALNLAPSHGMIGRAVD